ncbi:MAG: hypothetical protein IPG96_17695 [Proteobacteria bacterium]|nr:hypothetical protein [Pseudomonadota bacterium]
MSLPRPVIAGETVMITRRCTQRQFLLRPSAAVNRILGYCLAVAAERYGLRLHAFCAMSNHLHVVATDVHGNPPGVLPLVVRVHGQVPQRALGALGEPLGE